MVFVGTLQMNSAADCDGIAISGLLQKKAFSAVDKTATRNIQFSEAGIVHRLENTSLTHYHLLEDVGPPIFEPIYANTSSGAPTEKNEVLFKCPCCRESTSKMLCVVCVLQQLRVNKVRERYRALFLRKADLCRQIEMKLKPKTNFQIDAQEKHNSIKALKEKIKAKRDQINRMRQRIRNIDANNTTANKNIISIEKKLVAHAERLARLKSDIEHKRNTLLANYKALGENMAKASRELLTIFPIKRFEAPRSNGATNQKLPDAWRTGLTAKRPINFTIKNLLLNDYSEYDKLVAELCARSSPTPIASRSSTILNCNQRLSLPNKQTLGALLFLSKFVEQLAILLDCQLPYSRLNSCWGELSAGRSSCTENLFLTNVLKLNFCIVFLCISCGVQPALLDLKRPMNNIGFLINLINAPQKEKQSISQLQLRPAADNFNVKLHLQIVEEYQKTVWEDRHRDFTVDNIEEDWVNVAFAAK